jgi:serine/threonine protein kinase
MIKREAQTERLPSPGLLPSPAPAPAPVPDEVATRQRPDLPLPFSGPSVPGYELLGELGRGGMGVVYKARQKSLNRPVALKMLLGGRHGTAQALARFRNEAETVARLRHPHIVQVYEIGEVDGMPFFSMELVEGSSLAELLRQGPLKASTAARLIELLALAMHAAH